MPQPSGFVSDITCSEPIGASDPVAVVKLHDATVQGTPEVVLRNYADPDNPRTACRLASTSSRFVQLIDARHLVIESEGALAVVDLPDVTYHWFRLPDAGSSTTFIAVSPALDEVLWLATRGDASQPDAPGSTEIHVTSAAGDQVVTTIPRPVGGRCGSPEDSKQGAYTHSGSHAFVLDQPIQSYNSLVAFEGRTPALSLLAPPETGWSGDAFPAMATWSPGSDTLFYRQGADVWRWTPGSDAEVFLPGVPWYYPTISPDGRNLAYAVRRGDGVHDVYLLDLTESVSPRLIAEARNRPVFLNDDQLWYMSEGQGICGPGVDQPLIYNVDDGSEAASVIDSVLGTWPATGSNQ